VERKTLAAFAKEHDLRPRDVVFIAERAGVSARRMDATISPGQEAKMLPHVEHAQRMRAMDEGRSTPLTEPKPYGPALHRRSQSDGYSGR